MSRSVWPARFVFLATSLVTLSESAKSQQSEPPQPTPAASTDLPPLEVTTKQPTKKAKSVKKNAAPTAAVAPVPVPSPAPVKAAPTTVSAEPTPGINSIDVTSADLARNNATDVNGVFTGQPGILVGSSIPMSQKVYVHGIEETNLAVTIDGSRQNNKVFHHNGTNLIDPGLLKAVRVDAGVAPADAGPGALAGSIAYETKDVGDLLPGDGMGGFLKSQFNTNGDVWTNSVAGYGMSNGFEVLGYFTYADGNEFEAGNGQTVLGTSTHLLSGIGKLAYEADSGDRFEISHERVDDDAPRPFRANTVLTGRPFWEPAVRDYALDRQNTVFTYTDSKPNGWWDPKVVIAYSATTVDVPGYACPRGCPSGVPTTFPTTGESESFNGKVENRFALATGSVIAGVDFYRDEAKLIANSVALGFNDDSKEKGSNLGAYAQARLNPWDYTRLSFGMRADQHWFEGTGGQEFDDAGLSGNVSGEYDLTDWLIAKAGYSHVWAGTPLAENFIMNPAWTYGGGAEPVTAENATAGLLVHYRGFTAEATVFRTDIDDARIPLYAWSAAVPAPHPAALAALRARDIVSEGFELGTGYDWGSGFVRVKYAHIDVTINGQPADSDTGNYIATPVGDIITLTAFHTFTSIGVTVGGDVLIAPSYDRVVAGSPPYPGYEVVNLFAAWQVPTYPELTLRADVRNLFDETYADRATYGQEFGNVRPLYEPGRAFLITSTATF